MPVSTDHRNLTTLAVELLKAFKDLSVVIFAEVFPVRQSQYNMRNYSYFAMPRAKTFNHRLESCHTKFEIVWQHTIPYERDRLMLLKLENLICAHADFAKFI